MTKWFTSLLTVALLLVGGCKTTSTTPPKSQLEIRELQTRSYETSDVKTVMKVLVNVLQDEGFLVQSSNTELGLLTATKQIRVENEQDFGTVLPQLPPNVKLRKNSILDANAVATEYGTGRRVRVSFQIKMLSKSGKVRDAVAVEDAGYYQRFCSKVDKGLFLQAEKL